MTEARYDVLTWDPVAGQYTEQDGMVNPCLGVSIHGLRRALKELRSDFGYQCNRNYSDSDPSVLVERVDDPIVDALDFDDVK